MASYLLIYSANPLINICTSIELPVILNPLKNIFLSDLGSMHAEYVPQRKITKFSVAKSKNDLMKRGYSDNDTEKEFRKVDKLDRSNLLNYRKNTSKTNRVPFVVNYSKGLPDIHKILKNSQKNS
jgi:hypothetical protein